MKPQFVAIILFLWSIPFGAFAQKVFVEDVLVKGNQRTKDFVLLREIPVHPGDSISIKELGNLEKEIVRNITNTGLTNFIEVSYNYLDSSRITCTVEVLERWYIWPNLLFSLAETNFNSWWVNKDLDRINYGFSIDDYNFRGRREKLSISFQNGWTRKVGINYQIPGLNKKRTLGGGIELYYSNNREINHQIRYEPDSVFNQRDFLKAKRFIQEEFVGRIKLEYRPRYLNTHRWLLGFETVLIDDTVTSETSDYLPNGNKRSQYFYLSYGFKREKRDNRAYALNGYLIDGTIDQHGLGILNRNDIFLTDAKIKVTLHHPIQGRWYFAQRFDGKATFFGEPSYYFQRGLGYSNIYIRGYELYVIDGQHYALYRSNLKYKLMKKRTIDLKTLFYKFDKFHYSLFLNVFGDVGYVVDNLNPDRNPLANQTQYSYGIGLDFVSYYDLVVRFEASMNALGQPGFYINFRNSI